MGKIVAIANQKGGVGKTTTTINLGASLGILEQKILIVDNDDQCNATSGLGISKNDVENSIYNCLIEGADPKELIVETETPNVFLLPANRDLVGAKVELVTESEREYRLRKTLATVKDDYDYILIDCLPDLGILTVNALTAADAVIIPVQCEFFALEGLGDLVNTINLIKENLNPELEIEGILLTMFDTRLNLAHQVKDEVSNHFGDKVYQTIIHRNTRVAEAPAMGKPVVMYDASSKGAINFLNLAKEVMERNGSMQVIP